MSFNDNVRIDSGRVRDSRGSGGGGRGGIGGRGIAIGGGGGLLVLLLAIFAPGLLDQMGIDPTGATGGQAQQQEQPVGQRQVDSCKTGADANERTDCRIVATTESADAFWEEHLGLYRDVSFRQPQVELFEGGVNTGCGSASSAMGPFYCPADETMYFDTGFFSTLQTDFGAQGGPLAEQYIVAHEYAHHIQHVIGWLGAAQDGRTGAESGSVRLELQADCMAGMWAGQAASTVDPESGETFLKPITDEQLAQAIDAASAVGDDRIQQAATGRVNPEAFSHGTSQQRMDWFKRGYTTAEQDPDINQCDTFSVDSLDLS